MGQARGFLCYNNADLIRDGFIYSSMTAEYPPTGRYLRKLTKKPPTGSSFSAILGDDGEIVGVKEYRKILPASHLQLELDFSQSYPSRANPQASFSGSTFGGGALSAFGPGLVSVSSSGPRTAELTYQICDSRVHINKKIKITQAMLDNDGIIELDAAPLAVMCVVKGHKVLDKEGEPTGTETGLKLTSDQRKNIGKRSEGGGRSGPKHLIHSATISTGQTGNYSDRAEVNLELAHQSTLSDEERNLEEDQPNLFKTIVQDERKLDFRGDNFQSGNERYRPIKLRGKTRTDGMHKNIQIDMSDLEVGDYVYATMTLATGFHQRQVLRHTGSTLLGMVVSSYIDAFNFEVSQWRVPLLDDPENKFSVEEIASILRGDDGARDSDALTGWRQTTGTSSRLSHFIAADHRGIIVCGNYGSSRGGNSIIIKPASEIPDQEWFNRYLRDYETLIGSISGLPIDYDEENPASASWLTFNDYFKRDLTRFGMFVLDTNEAINSIAYDREKPYYFGLLGYHLNFIKRYDVQEWGEESSPITGMAMANPQLWFYEAFPEGVIPTEAGEILEAQDTVFNSNVQYLDYLDIFDMSFATFDYPKMVYNTALDVDPTTPLSHENFQAMTVDSTFGTDVLMGILDMLGLAEDAASIDNQAFWRETTPWYMGDFTRNTRLYCEKVRAGIWSMVHASTVPVVPEKMSIDKHKTAESSTLVAYDDEMFQSLSSFELEDEMVLSNLDYFKIDLSKNHLNWDIDYKKNVLLGGTRFLGDTPSFGKGIPISNDFAKIFYANEVLTFDDYYKDRLCYVDQKIDYSTDPPSYVFNFGEGHIRTVTIAYKNDDDVNPIDYGIDIGVGPLGADAKDCSYISKIVLPKSKGKLVTMDIDMRLYKGEELKFYGDVWSENVIQSFDTTIGDIETFDGLKLYASQTAMVKTVYGTTAVFYSDDTTQNISVAIDRSGYAGTVWEYYKDIIYLTNSETAEFPFVVKDPLEPNKVYLYYILNTEFLMCKEIDFAMIDPSDQFVSYESPDVIELDGGQINVEPLKVYSDKGRSLRIVTSYFVHGNADSVSFDTYMTTNLATENIIRQTIAFNDDQSKDGQVGLPFLRFEYKGNNSWNSGLSPQEIAPDMDSPFSAASYTVHTDAQGLNSVFWMEEGKMIVKISGNQKRWGKKISDIELHRDFFDDTLNEGNLGKVTNIQVVKDYFSDDIMTFLYVYNGMIFKRTFFIALPADDESEYGIKGNFEFVDVKKDNLPTFIMGHIPDYIIQYLESSEETTFENNRGDDDKLAFHIPYSLEDMKKFNGDFEIDVNSAPIGYTLKTGETRVFYKDIESNICALTMRGDSDILPEVSLIDAKRDID